MPQFNKGLHSDAWALVSQVAYSLLLESQTKGSCHSLLFQSQILAFGTKLDTTLSWNSESKMDFQSWGCIRGNLTTGDWAKLRLENQRSQDLHKANENG